jgi:L-threonylcarbamoyladenylate synthase
LDTISADLEKQVTLGIDILRRGGVIAYPTDTVYGLGASMTSPEAVGKIFLVKSRPRHMSLPLLVGSISQIEMLSAYISPTAHILIKAFLPGALTLIFSASDKVPAYLKAREDTIALRIPDHPVPLALINGIGTALVGTSANLSGYPNPLTDGEVKAQLADRVELVIEGGRCSGTESTIIDVSGEVPVLLRKGAISVSEIEKACGKIRTGNGG